MSNDLKEKLVFAPLIRVSTERQERQGESLCVQKEQLNRSIEILNGEIYKWFEGQEHGTPDHERKILEELMADAQRGKFTAIIVADASRWSRDNEKNKKYLRVLKQHKIRFFQGPMEINLFDPNQEGILLGVNVEIQELFAKQQNYKSLLSRMARAERGDPACGKKPIFRYWDKKLRVWKIDEVGKAKIEKIANEYLDDDIAFNVLGPKYGMNGANLHKVLCYRCGDTWEIEFNAPDFNIHKTFTLTIPRLLPEETIQAIRKKAAQRNCWDKKSQKHNYLFAKLILDTDTLKALTGTCNSKGVRYYKPYLGCKHRYQVNADVLEQAILTELFEILGNKQSLRVAVFDGNPLGKVASKLQNDLTSKQAGLKLVETRIANYLTMIENCQDDVVSLLDRIKPKLQEHELKSRELKNQIASIEHQLATLPDEKQIESRRRKWAGLVERIRQSYLESGQAFRDLPFDAQRKLIKLIFGGTDERGRRFGIYVKFLGGDPRKYKFEAYGRLGRIDGWIESRSGEFYADSSNGPTRRGITGEIAKIILENDPSLEQGEQEEKAHLSIERHAHHRLSIYQ